MLLQATTKMSEFMTLHASHFGCIKSAVLTVLRQMYIDGSCPGLGMGIKIVLIDSFPYFFYFCLFRASQK